MVIKIWNIFLILTEVVDNVTKTFKYSTFMSKSSIYYIIQPCWKSSTFLSFFLPFVKQFFQHFLAI